MSWGMATCTSCGAPLIPTMVFPKFEFYCLECGSSFGFMSPRGVEPTPEIEARYEALKAEWDEHAGGKLITPNAWRAGCPQCWRDPEHTSGTLETHDLHATAEERDEDLRARMWLRERASQPQPAGEGRKP